MITLKLVITNKKIQILFLENQVLEVGFLNSELVYFTNP
jgi:hypothetical protein